MQFSSTPSSYSSAFEEAIFVIEADEDELVLVDIYDKSEELIAQKTYKGSTRHTLNTSPYAQALLEVEPVQSDECGFHAQLARTVYLTLKSGDVGSYTTQTGAIEGFKRYSLLSKSPATRTITTSGRDELSLSCGAYTLKAYVTLHQGSDSVQMLISQWSPEEDGVHAFVLDIEDLQSKLDDEGMGSILNYDSFELMIDVGGDPLIYRTYEAVAAQSDDVTLCWWNTYGGIDYYTFKARGEAQLVCEKSRIYTSSGYTTLSSEAAYEAQLFSPYLTSEYCAWLSEIIASPQVWRVEGSTYTPVEILNEQVTTRSEDLIRLELLITPSLKTCYLTH